MTREPEFFKRIYQGNIPVKYDKYWIGFSIPIGTVKEKRKLNFIQEPLPWHINYMTKTDVVTDVWLMLMLFKKYWLLQRKSKRVGIYYKLIPD